MQRFNCGPRAVDRYVGNNGDNVHVDKKELARLADDGLNQTLEDSGYSTRECEDWAIYFRPVKYNNGEANVMACNVSEEKTLL